MLILKKESTEEIYLTLTLLHSSVADKQILAFCLHYMNTNVMCCFA